MKQENDIKTAFDKFANYLSGDFAAALDKVDGKLFFKNYADKEKLAKKLVTGNTAADSAAPSILISHIPDEINRQISQTLANIKSAPQIIVQSANSIGHLKKSKMRNYFRSKYENAFVEFQINKKLLGGIKVFENGKVTDNSWEGKIAKIRI